ncbi:hypothetical protein Plec18167_006492 [Paecilomyces lecythidis]|uniref:ribonuclease H n=1 Tax=Paecilomyces lecythidis TaxID=3004212 RepID=A0ABR3XAY8_9EURO
MIVAIDGACSNNGKLGALSAFAVYFGPGNHYNTARTSHFRERHTSQLAELDACLEALMLVARIQAEQTFDNGIDIVVIKSDSEYVVRGLTEWMPKWKKNNWKNSRGTPVANAMEFMLLGALIGQLQEQMSVKFWLVPRELNVEADSLAKSALESRIRDRDYSNDDL